MQAASLRSASGNMIETGLKEWLNREEAPSDFYELLGQPRLCRDRERLLASLEEASEYLFQCQNHKDKDIRDRARSFHRLVAEARRTIADESRWEQYDRDLIQRLYRRFQKNPDFAGPHPKLDNLRRWLALVQNVDPARIEELIADWLAESKREKSSAQPKVERETQTHAAKAQTEAIAKLFSKNGSSKALSSDGADAGEPAADSPSDLEIFASIPSALPPPPGRSVSREREIKVPPPPPAKTAVAQQTPTVATPVVLPAVSRSTSSGFDRGPRGSGNDNAALWIVMAALLTALVLGMLALAIAWASGAFERGRSEVKPTAPRAIVENRQMPESGGGLLDVDQNANRQPGSRFHARLRFGFDRDTAIRTTADDCA